MNNVFESLKIYIWEGRRAQGTAYETESFASMSPFQIQPRIGSYYQLMAVLWTMITVYITKHFLSAIQDSEDNTITALASEIVVHIRY